MLALRGLVKSFGGVRAVDGVDYAMADGALACIIGPNGCGKTTLFNLITGYLQPTAGAVSFAGRPIAGLPLHRVARLGLVRKFQVPSVFPQLSVADNIAVARAAARASQPMARLEPLFRAVGLDFDNPGAAGALSHGQKQWLELAMVLTTGPRLVLLDEPAAGMTRPEKDETLRLLARLREETGIGILLIEHDMDFVEALDCPVSVMVLGRIVAAGSFGEVRRDPLVREAYLGTRQAARAAHG